MSVLKAMRGESAMQFVETARKLEAHAFSVVTKAPKRYGPYLLQPIMALASAVHDNVRAANNTIRGIWTMVRPSTQTFTFWKQRG